ncbi:uncharacterized protein CIMG_08530 [Coccidioides immitis RS]|uniref:Uncharacterized protein n=1 Tax=Coccidioides immitis (strain RS) TaxID=246410 RepID=J3K5P4_COCIM|nr:uncharacterized protein CIMG_08530 [Coccidioides immitis RS]EAS29784.3 hypothetical protein CIMG_08530 [Coccidioides immitis RS]
MGQQQWKQPRWASELMAGWFHLMVEWKGSSLVKMVQRQYWPECRRREDAPSCPYKLLRTETHIEAMESSRTHSWDAHGRRLFPHKLQPSHATTRARHVTHLKRRNAAERGPADTELTKPPKRSHTPDGPGVLGVHPYCTS